MKILRPLVYIICKGNSLALFFLLALADISSAQGINELWGMSTSGGNDNLGVIFSMDGNGNNFQIRNSFRLSAVGEDPRSDLVLFNSKFYGMTDWGGASDGGVIFEWDPQTNIYTKKIDLTFVNGYHPTGSLVLFNGKFYGMTAKGGISDSGVIFEWDPANNTYTKKINLTPSNGGYPTGGLTEFHGKFYGMTYGGGTNNMGVIFEWDPANNTYTKKINLSLADGAYPGGNLSLYNNTFYGMTYAGGANSKGVIFEWNPETNIYSKKIDLSTALGGGPQGSLILKDDSFFGMTSNGGANNYGVLFEWKPTTNLYTKKVDLSTANGGNARGNLVLFSEKFYGMTYAGGASANGTIFEWEPSANIFSKKIDFNSSNGKFPYGSLTVANGKLYGMTSDGGGMNSGTIFEFAPSGNTFTKKIDFGVTNGKNPFGILTFKDGKAYGTTRTGGSNLGNGVIFELDPSTNTNTTKINFASPEGGAPEGDLTLVNGKFYGTAYSGGANNTGVIFEWDPALNTYKKKFDFVTSSGWAPSGIMNYYNGKFYGSTFKGGVNNAGVIFEWDPVSGIYSKKYDFNVNDGLAGAGMTLYNGRFYGMTVHDLSSGNNPYGIIFEWDPSSNQFSKKIDLALHQGGGFNFSRNLVFSNQKFYGVSTGGANNLGFIFEWDPASNVLTKRFDFSVSTGSFGATSLTYSQGKFYGMNSYGGNNNYGVVFEWDPATNMYTKKVDFDGINGKNPGSGNGLLALPSPVADLPKGTCTTVSSVTINDSNNTRWVAITDGYGHAIAEINGNGNNLGIVNTTVFINDKKVREDGGKNLFLDRNLSITPQHQPSSPVSIRLYIKAEELQAFKMAVNSNGEASGINEIGDINIFKTNSGCNDRISSLALPVITTATSWGNNGYVLTASVTSFSSFYFARNTNPALPVKLISFSGEAKEKSIQLKWSTSSESNSANYELQRSINATVFKTLGIVSGAVNSSSQQDYMYVDRDPLSEVAYYRLKMNDQDGTFAFSKIIAIELPGPDHNKNYVFPNPSSHALNFTLHADDNVVYKIFDQRGRLVKENKLGRINTPQFLRMDISVLVSGVYSLTIQGDKSSETLKFIKQ